MKKVIRKISVILAMGCMMALSMTGCGKRECDACGEKAKCTKIESDGDTLYLCSDCKDLYDLGSKMKEQLGY